MTPEEFDRIKKAEKEHLRKLKKLKEAHRQLERQKKMTDAVSDMTTSMQEKLDVHADMMDKIGTDSALNEARLEMALESSEKAELEAQERKDEQELTKAKAKELVRQMKAGENISPLDPEDSRAAKSSDDPKSSEDDDQDKDLPEKTIGRMKP
ncbi:MAG: hypothetical protein BMS9Abin05_1529 [Rhodothermia bacterium]|nr:MAG: hypothetical protein BMS9Abin05_1529 [Rhodothermia bacterium]